jgi:hypothetical protein
VYSGSAAGPQDRAAIVTRIIRQLIADGARERLHENSWPPGLFSHIECLLRDEFADERQQAILETHCE